MTPINTSISSPASSMAKVRDFYAALERRDRAEIAALLAPDIEVRQSSALPWGGVWRGQDGFQDFFASVSACLEANLAVEEIFHDGDDVVVRGRSKGLARATGECFEIAVVHVWRVREERLANLRIHADAGTLRPLLSAEVSVSSGL